MLSQTVSSASQRGISMDSMVRHTHFTSGLCTISGTSGKSSWASMTRRQRSCRAASHPPRSVSVSFTHTASGFNRTNSRHSFMFSSA